MARRSRVDADTQDAIADFDRQVGEISRALQRQSERVQRLEGVSEDLVALAGVPEPAPEATPRGAGPRATPRSASRAVASRGQPPVRVVTVVTREMIPQAQTMARSLLRTNPDWVVEAVLLGPATGAGHDSGGDELTVVGIQDLLGLDPAVLLARHTAAMLTVLLAPRVLLARSSADHPVAHLPASAWVLHDLAPLVSQMGDRPVLLAPRLQRQLPSDGLEPSAARLHREGRVAPDLIATDGSPRAADFLYWWISRLDEIIGTPEGPGPGHPPEDRHWIWRSLELACRRADVATSTDAWNISAWNLSEHTLRDEGDQITVDDRCPLLLIDLPGFEPDRPFRINGWASRVRVSQDRVLRRLTTRYAEALLASGGSDVTHRRRMGWPLANGLVLDADLVDLLTTAHTLGTTISDPESESGTRAFMDWLHGPAALGGRHGVNRYLLHRVVRHRRDVVLAFPDLDGVDGPALVQWAHDQGQQELGIPDLLMPKRSAGARPRDAGPKGGGQTPSERAATPAGAGLGVRVSGYLGHVLGLGAAARAYADALKAAAVPVSTVTVSVDRLRPPISLEAGYGRHQHEDVVSGNGHAFELICVNPGELSAFIESFPPGFFDGFRIGVWGWESNTIPPDWAPAFGLVDEIWVYSRFVADNIAAVTDIPVVALPPPVHAASGNAAPFRLGVPEGFLFLFVFDYSSTNQRKNPTGLIEAFRRAFAPGEGPQLLIKTINAPLLPLSQEEVLWAARDRPDIHVIDRSLTSEERDALIATCDCYVSLHRSEGFGLTMAEAMAAGKPVIGTAFSGNIDFMNPENSLLVDYKLTRVGPEVQIYPADGVWAEPSIVHAAALMRRVVDDPHGAARIGARARRDIATGLSPVAAGARVRRRLEELTRPGGVAAPEPP
jgi:glycosyltransferase involved in cell wall biosynthesis